MKRVVAIRLFPELLEEVQSLSPNVSQAVEQALVAWIARQKRKAAKTGPDPLARHSTPPTELEIATHTGTSTLHDAKDGA